MVIALLALQVAGFAVIFVLLRRAVMRRIDARDVVPELRAEVGALIAELNGTTERNVALLEDGIERLHELLRRADKGVSAPSEAPLGEAGSKPRSTAERRAQVLRLRRMGLSNEAIVDRLATSPGEVELIVNLADRMPAGRSS